MLNHFPCFSLPSGQFPYCSVAGGTRDGSTNPPFSRGIVHPALFSFGACPSFRQIWRVLVLSKLCPHISHIWGLSAWRSTDNPLISLLLFCSMHLEPQGDLVHLPLPQSACTPSHPAASWGSPAKSSPGVSSALMCWLHLTCSECDSGSRHSPLNFVLSDDGKSVKQGDRQQDIPDIAERFNPCCCTLGCDGFTFRETLLRGGGDGCRRWAMGSLYRRCGKERWCWT